MNNGHIVSPIRYVTTCKLCHRQVAEAPNLEIPIIGNPGKKAEDLMRVLLKHLTKHHQEDFKRGAQLSAELPPFLILSAFEHEDPSIIPRLENIRAAIFAQVRKNSFTDSSLQGVVAAFGLDPDDAAKVLDGMKAVRDACCEFGEYAPKIVQESKIVSA
jgi:hypothetical protein